MEKIKKFNTQIASHLANNLENSLRELRRCGAHRSSKATFTEMGIQLSGFKMILQKIISLMPWSGMHGLTTRLITTCLLL